MQDNFYKSILDWCYNFLADRPLLGWSVAGVLLLIAGFKFLCNLIPQFEIFNSKILIPVAKRLKHKKLVKAAIKSDIRGHVNHTVQKLEKELPMGWVQEMDIEWVEKESKDDFVNDNTPVIRMRPLEDQDRNFVTAVYHFFKKTFFPKTNRVIPETPREASILYMSRRLIYTEKRHLEPVFDDYILEPAVEKRGGIINYLERYKKIDTQGFFTGTFLREVHEIADQVKFTKMRKHMGQEIAEILKHIEKFIDHLNSEEEQIPPGGWHRFGPITSYSFLLIAHPLKTQKGIKAYLNRAREKLENGASRLYVFGTARETWFAKSVINSISHNIPGWQLVEKFSLYYDYRGKKGGIGALFVARSDLSKNKIKA